MGTASKVSTKTETEYLSEVYEAMQLLKRNTLAKANNNRRRAEHLRNLNTNPDIARKRVEGLKMHYVIHPEHRKRQSEIMKAVNKNNPDISKRKSEKMKVYYQQHQHPRKGKQKKKLKLKTLYEENR